MRLRGVNGNLGSGYPVTMGCAWPHQGLRENQYINTLETYSQLCVAWYNSWETLSHNIEWWHGDSIQLEFGKANYQLLGDAGSRKWYIMKEEGWRCNKGKGLVMNEISSEFLNPKESCELLWLPLSNAYRVKTSKIDWCDTIPIQAIANIPGG